MASIERDHAFLVNYLEAFYGMKAHVLVRFGKWREAIDLPLPTDQSLYCTLTANTLYAKGVAHAALGEAPQLNDLVGPEGQVGPVGSEDRGAGLRSRP